MGIIVDEKKAKKTPCRCYKTNGAMELLCFSEGAVGVLDEKQEVEYCTVKNVIENGGGLKREVQGLTDAIDEAKEEFWESLDEDEEVDKFIKKLGEKLRHKGVYV